METPLTPMEFVRRARSLYSHREAVVDGELRLSYAEFLSRCDRFSATLQRWGIRPGDRVAYIAPNTHANLEGYYAVPQIGAVVVPINFRLTSDDFAYIIGHSGAKVVCAHGDYLEAVDRVRPQLEGVERFVALEGLRPGWLRYEDLLRQAPNHCEPAIIAESDLISINYTSGTTARPKGVMITHRNAYTNVLGTLIHQPLTPADRYLWTLPMFHANGWTFVWTVAARGAAHICLRRTEPATILAAIESERVTMFCAAPTVLIGLANAPADQRPRSRRPVRLFTAGAAPAAATIERIERDFGWTLTHVYGLTETSPLISVCEELPEHAALSATQRAQIKARQGVELVTSGELHVVDAEGRDVPRDGTSVGEIVVRGNAVMRGYFNDPEATALAMRGGWFHSGDAAVVHPDGYIEIRDRLKDVIISGGENISTVEVEGVLLQHAAIREAAVVGMPHERWGEAPHAFVVLQPGAQADAQEIREFVRARLAHFKAPQWVTFVAELPKTATGKIQKFILRGRRGAIAQQ